MEDKITGSLLLDPTDFGILVLDGSNWNQSKLTTSGRWPDILNIIEQDSGGGELNTKMLLFARWVTTNYGTPQYNVNGYDGEWWKKTLKYFNETVYPTMVENGSVDNTDQFLRE